MTAHPARALRAAIWLAAFASSSALSALGIRGGLDSLGVAAPYVDLDSMAPVEATLAELAVPRGDPSERRVALLGDSTAIIYRDRPAGVDRRLEPALAALGSGARYRVYSFAFLGFTVFTDYFLAHRVADARPDRALLAFNLYELSDQWRRSDRARFAGWLPLRHLGEALRLPLHAIGLSTDELLLYASAVELGGFGAWDRATREQARCVRAWRELASGLQARSPWPGGMAYREQLEAHRIAVWFDPGPPERENPTMVEQRLAAALAGPAPDHPALQLLRAAVGAFRSRGIPTLVYAVPLNVEHHARLGLYAPGGLASALAAVRAAVEASGARFLDLHDALPDAAFSDGSGHLVVGPPLDAPGRVAERLAAALLELGSAPAPR